MGKSGVLDSPGSPFASCSFARSKPERTSSSLNMSSISCDAPIKKGGIFFEHLRVNSSVGSFVDVIEDVPRGARGTIGQVHLDIGHLHRQKGDCVLEVVQTRSLVRMILLGDNGRRR